MRYLLLFVGLSVAGCSASGLGRSDFDLAGCTADDQCTGATPRCDIASRRCVPCLPASNDCPPGTRCIDINGGFRCSSACRDAMDCPKSDGGVSGACCDGVCVDTSIHVENCGGCGMACPLVENGAPACAGGRCHPDCAPGFADCDGDLANGCEVDITGDVANCGGCRQACATPHGTPACMAGACRIAACDAGFADCDKNAANGCEVDVNLDAKNCGKCGMVCPMATPTCVAGMCSANCKPPAVCKMGNDLHTGSPWVVCTADCASAWLSAINLGGTYHSLEICQALGYTKVGLFGGTCGWTSCSRCQQGTSCNAPGVQNFDGGGDCGKDQWGPVLCGNVQWTCLR